MAWTFFNMCFIRCFEAKRLVPKTLLFFEKNLDFNLTNFVKTFKHCYIIVIHCYCYTKNSKMSLNYFQNYSKFLRYCICPRNYLKNCFAPKFRRNSISVISDLYLKSRVMLQIRIESYIWNWNYSLKISVDFWFWGPKNK